MFINLTNHPTSKWDEKQLNAAMQLSGDGRIIDISFPDIDPEWDESKIDELAKEYCQKVLSFDVDVVHLMGEFTFVYRLINLLKQKNIKIVASTTKRESVEKDGVKTSIFKFVKFREY